jgi:hypothetical protein
LFNRETAILDWARAIERNRDALTGIVAALFAMLGLEAGGTLGGIPRELHRSVLRVLRPAESAVRRLIAARGLVLKPVPSRPWQKGRVIGKGGRPGLPFALFDTRKRFDFNRSGRIPDHKRPRIWVFDDTPPNVRVFRPEDFGRSVPEKEEDAQIDAARLGRRLMAIKLALEDLPRQAKRLVRLKARREALQKQGRAVFISPMRHGRPPGYRKRRTHEVDEVLIECHGLARDVERLDSSRGAVLQPNRAGSAREPGICRVPELPPAVCRAMDACCRLDAGSSQVRGDQAGCHHFPAMTTPRELILRSPARCSPTTST